MYYLSRMALNGRRRHTALLLSNPQKMHAAVESCFYNDDEAQNPRSLWRVERHQHRVALWLMSTKVPSFELLQEQAGWSAEPTWETREYDPLLNRLMRGQQYQFRLTVNPTKDSVCADGQKRRLGIFRETDQIQWLLDRQTELGFQVSKDEVPTFAVSRSDRVRFRKNDGKGPTVTLQSCQFDGLLEVNDPEKLKAALTNGVGRAKAYGFGLLTLAPGTR
jgi:hypothetical protein